MDRYELLMAKLAEEAGEVVQSAIKCMQFGLDDVYENVSARQKLHSELNDLYAVVNLLNAEMGLDFIPDAAWTELKKSKIDKWAVYASHVNTEEVENDRAHEDFINDSGIYDVSDAWLDEFDVDDITDLELPEPDKQYY